MGKTQRKIYEDSRYYLSLYNLDVVEINKKDSDFITLRLITSDKKVVARKTVSKIDFSYPMQVQDLILIHATDRGNNEGLRE